MRKKALLYISSYKFTSIDHYKNEFDAIEKKYNIKIIIHDLSQILSKRLDSVFFFFFLKKNYKKFYNLSSWKNAFNKLNSKYNLMVFNSISGYGFNTIPINLHLKKSNVPIIVSPSPQVLDPKLEKNFEFYKYRLRKFFSNPFIVYYYLRIYCITFLNSFINFSHIYILQSGTFKNYSTLNANKNSVVDFHARDLSNFLISKKKNIKNKSLITYIDAAGPYFASDWTMIGKKFSFDIAKWYQEINKFLDFVEKKYKTKVIVIPHPKNRELSNPFFNENHGRQFDRSTDASTKLIPKSKFVLSCNSHSTAISYAIVSSTPWLYTYTNQLKTDLRLYVNLIELAKATGSQTLNISKNFKTFDFKNLKINQKKYDEYKYKFLTSKKIKNVPNYKIISKLIFRHFGKRN